jgi:hypothetical protein
MEPTPEGRIAAVAREEIYRTFRLKRTFPPDYADFRAAVEAAVRMEILAAKLEEAQLKPANDARVKELLGQLRATVERKKTK